MSKSIYTIFDCKNKTEFIKKLKSEDKSFEDIFSLAKEYKDHYKNKKTYKISAPDDIKELIETYGLYPTEKTSIILHLTARNELIEANTIHDINELPIIVDKPTTHCIVSISNSSYTNKTISSYANTLSIDSLESITFNENEVFYETACCGDLINKKQLSEKELLNNIEKLNTNLIYKYRLDSLNGYYEFNDILKNHYLNKIIKEKVSITNESKIDNLLTNALQYSPNENVIALFYDKNNIIKSIELLGIGDIDSSCVNVRLLQNKLLDNKIKGVMITHNHPSGDSRASHQDLKMTENLISKANVLKKEMYDHVVIGKYNTYRFSTRMSFPHNAHERDAKKQKAKSITFSR